MKIDLSTVPRTTLNDPTPEWVKAVLKRRPRVVERLRKVRTQILASPEHFDMGKWIQHESCGTTCCIGGWYSLKRQVRVGQDMLLVDLGLRQRRAEDSYNYTGEPVNGNIQRLVYDDLWPEPFKAEFHAATTKRDQARVAAKRITHFIRTGE